MKKLTIGLIDLVCKGPSTTLWGSIMHANLASIMPQVIATWCEQEGHAVTLLCYTGNEDLTRALPSNVDVVFISSFTHAALLGYALSNYFRSKGAVTVLGGPHARCYPEDAAQYFDYVLGFTDRSTITEMLSNVAPQRPVGQRLSAGRQTVHLCGVEERWKFIAPTLKKAPLIKIVPMLASVGCPYTCSFCIDSVVPYQPLDVEVIKSDLQFLAKKFERPTVGWHDPNFGVRFDQTMDAITSAAAPKKFRFIAESSLSILTDDRLQRLHDNGFIALLPGVESWFDLGNKSRASRITGEEKVNQVSGHVNRILQLIPYIQTNFVLGMDNDAGAEPFELTKRFIDRSPGAFPGFSLLTAFGEAAPLNLDYQRVGRVLPFPFHFLNNHLAMNVRPKNYDWVDFYDRVIDLTTYAFSAKRIYRRFIGSRGATTKWMNMMRAVSSEGWGRLKFYRKIRENLVRDRSFRQYFEGASAQLPAFYTERIRDDLGMWWQWLPQNAVAHNAYAYLDKTPGASGAVAHSDFIAP